MIYLKDDELRIVNEIISCHVQSGTVFIFGSWHKGNNKPYSDLDLAFNLGRKLTLRELGDIKEDFEVSELNFRVDVLDYCGISQEFRKIIDVSHEVIFCSDND